MPTVIMESLAMGLAILGTDVGAISKQIDGNGWLVSAPEIPLLKKALIQAMEADPATVDAFKRRSLEKVKAEFLWDKVIELKVRLMKGALFHASLYWIHRPNPGKKSNTSRAERQKPDPVNGDHGTHPHTDRNYANDHAGQPLLG